MESFFFPQRPCPRSINTCLFYQAHIKGKTDASTKIENSMLFKSVLGHQLDFNNWDRSCFESRAQLQRFSIALLITYSFTPPHLWCPLCLAQRTNSCRVMAIIAEYWRSHENWTTCIPFSQDLQSSWRLSIKCCACQRDGWFVFMSQINIVEFPADTEVRRRSGRVKVSFAIFTKLAEYHASMTCWSGGWGEAHWVW